MGGVILPLQLPPLPFRGTVCVMGDKSTGFDIGHESSSGNSWGSFSGPYYTGQEAIAAAFALNRDVYFGGCNVEICQAALNDRDGVTAAPSKAWEEFGWPS